MTDESRRKAHEGPDAYYFGQKVGASGDRQIRSLRPYNYSAPQPG